MEDFLHFISVDFCEAWIYFGSLQERPSLYEHIGFIKMQSGQIMSLEDDIVSVFVVNVKFVYP